MFKKENTVLVLIDVQGKLAQLMHKREALFKNLQIIIKSMKILNIPIIWLEQIPKNLGPTIPELSELLPDLKPIPKSSFSAWGEEKFVEAFNAINRKQVLLTGIETHICVFQTAVDLRALGCEVQAVVDCISSRTPENKEIGLEKIKDSGASKTTLESILFELMKEAGGKEFKEIVKLIK